VQARTARAYSLKEAGRVGEAIAEFRVLMEKCDPSHPLRPRILCGFAYCRPELTHYEWEGLLTELEFYHEVIPLKPGSLDKIGLAIAFLEREYGYKPL